VTALNLFLWISLGIGLQVAVYLGIAFWRHSRDYGALGSGDAQPVASPAVRLTTDEDSVLAPAWTGLRPFRVERKVTEDAARTACSLYLVPEDGRPLPPFLPGQFLTFHLELPSADGGTERVVRCYSLSDAPYPDHYRVTIKRVSAPAGQDAPPGRASGFVHDHVVVGDVLQVRAPGGHFHLDRSAAPAVLISGGIGITPMLSMLNSCLAEQPGREVWFFHAVRNGRELVMRAHLEALAAAHPNLHLWLCFSNPSEQDVPGRDFRHRGRIDIELLRLHLPFKPCHFYLCGPGPLMGSLVPALSDWGVPQTEIHFEAFGPASFHGRSLNVRSPSSAGSDRQGSGIVVTFAQSGKQLNWQPSAGTLLEFAEANGIAVSSGCRSGGCGTCQTTIQSGQVSYRQAPDYDPEPGTCLLCSCVPATSVTLEA
jgi:ferredoxin-NADP reductase